MIGVTRQEVLDFFVTLLVVLGLLAAGYAFALPEAQVAHVLPQDAHFAGRWRVGEVQGAQGMAGWYLSDVTVVLYKQTSSPLEEMAYGLGAWFPDYETTFHEEGVQVAMVPDGFGREEPLAVRIDKTAPYLQWGNLRDGATAAGAFFTVSGFVSDPISLPARVELSLDGGKSWIPMDLAGAPEPPTSGDVEWNFVWDTTRFLDGPYQLQARARDTAGNWSDPIQLQLTVENHYEP